MRKATLLLKMIPLCLFTGITVTSCYEEDESKLMVNNHELARYAIMLDEAEKLINEKGPQIEATILNDSKNPDILLKEYIPDEYIPLSNNRGNIGLVDLGLSKKWAYCNLLGVSTHHEKICSSLKEFLGIDKKPILENITSSIALDAYLSGAEEESTKMTAEKYLKQVYEYVENYQAHLGDYYRYLWENKYYFLYGTNNDYFLFGQTSPMNPALQYPTGLSNDPASYQWGNGWETPSDDDFEELLTRCSWRAGTINGKKGVSVTGPNGKSIWLPLVGAKNSNGRIANPGIGYYMSSSLSEGKVNTLVIDVDNVISVYPLSVGSGFCVRPVRKK